MTNRQPSSAVALAGRVRTAALPLDAASDLAPLLDAIGDAHFTNMARHGMVNVGQLVRRAHGETPSDREGVGLVGFGTHRGTVIAAQE